jgi:demethylmenaquinone methyltransferase/2-methoxy-6-polyprenyl-1,4-benzoquinol methylase
VTEGEELPGSVRAAYERASSAGFELACEVEVGRLLAALAAAVLGGGRVLEIGTGVGVGLAWLVHGLGARRDVEVVTVELDDEVQRTALSAPWPPWVRFESGDGAKAVGGLGQFDLIFPDAPGGKIFKLSSSVPSWASAAASSWPSSAGRDLRSAHRNPVTERDSTRVA